MQLSVIEITPLETKFVRLRLIMNATRSNNVGTLFVYVLIAPFFITAISARMILTPDLGGWPFAGSSWFRYGYPLVAVLVGGIFVAIVHFITMLAVRLSRPFYMILTLNAAAMILLPAVILILVAGNGDGATTPSQLVGVAVICSYMVLLGAFLVVSGVTAVLLSTRERQRSPTFF